jgi:cytochrome c oxidase assembly protein subunit 11
VASTGLQRTANRKLVGQLLVLTAMMFGFGYALVPLYNVFCEVTGINGKTGRLSPAQAATLAPDKTREITVEFVTNVNAGLPWNFRPLQDKIVVHPGELTSVAFEMGNRANYPIVGQAIPSLAPQTAARYFSKTECFCFSRQPLAAGEQKTVPVKFIIDPKIPADVDRVTLSYTFFEAPPSSEPTAAVKGSAPNT